MVLLAFEMRLVAITGWSSQEAKRIFSDQMSLKMNFLAGTHTVIVPGVQIGHWGKGVGLVCSFLSY
jgi:hypothetical protein